MSNIKWSRAREKMCIGGGEYVLAGPDLGKQNPRERDLSLVTVARQVTIASAEVYSQ